MFAGNLIFTPSALFPVPFFTLTSDTGTNNYIAGAARGIILRHHPQAQIADISHQITAFNLYEAAYNVGNAYHLFPLHTWHIIMVSLFDNQQNRILIARHNNMFFAVPDNGLLPMILGMVPEECVSISLSSNDNILSWMDAVSKTAALIIAGNRLTDVGEDAWDLVVKHVPKPTVSNDYMEGVVLSIDAFENVIINIQRKEFDDVCKGRRFEIRFRDNEIIRTLSTNYNDVADGSKLAFFNAAGYLEIAVNKGRAASLFGLQPHSGQADARFHMARMQYHAIRISFLNS